MRHSTLAALISLVGLPVPVAACASPSALVASPGGRILYVACADSNRVLMFDLRLRRQTRNVTVPGPPSSLVLSSDGTRLYAVCPAPASRVCVIDTARAKVIETLPAGHTASAVALSLDGKSLFVCNRFDNDVSVIDLKGRTAPRRIRVEREPVAAAVTPDGRFVLVANRLHNGRADVDYVAAAVSIVDAGAGTVVKELRLPNGSGSLQDIRVSPDGRHAAVTHLISRVHVPTSQLERGWMNNNAMTIIALPKMEIITTVLLDGVSGGAANPWGLAWTGDSKGIVVAHAGSHEVSVIDFPTLQAKLARLPAARDHKELDFVGASQTLADVPNDLSFLTGVRRLVALPDGDQGPRAVAVAGSTACVGNYFSGTLSAIDLDKPLRTPRSIPLGPKQPLKGVRLGEFYFHDARLCFQRWQSCASCHPDNGRSDALNWDLLNDGLANPKNTLSLLLSHRTPPAMSLGVRENAESAVRAGVEHILLTVQPDEVAQAIDEYLKSLKPVPSPHLVNGELSAAARRGRELFNSTQTGCAVCHPPGLFTDLKPHDVGTRGRFDSETEEFDTPTLIEVWRTAPYLHDGSAATMRDALTIRNSKDRHGTISHLTKQQINDLVEYVLSL